MCGWLRLKSSRRRILGGPSGYPAVNTNVTGSTARTPDGLTPAARQVFASSVRTSTTARVASLPSMRSAVTPTTDGCASMRRSARRTAIGMSFSAETRGIGSSVRERLAADAGTGGDADGERCALEARPSRGDLDHQRIVARSVGDAFEFALHRIEDVDVF